MPAGDVLSARPGSLPIVMLDLSILRSSLIEFLRGALTHNRAFAILLLSNCGDGLLTYVGYA